MKTNFSTLSIVLWAGLLSSLHIHAEELRKANVASGDRQQDEVSIAALRAKSPQARLIFEKSIYQRELYNGELVSYWSDGLKIYALLNIPNSSKPKDGYPVLIYGHGFHPEPQNYGIRADGIVSRPGDYYRGIPERYAAAGYLVLSPDYRGHNISEGFEFTKTSYLASSYYASDVLHLLSAIPSLPQADPSRIFYAGHSMGGEVGLKALLATDKIRAASLWSPVVGTTAQQVLYYGRYYDKAEAANPDTEGASDIEVNAAKLKEYSSKIDAVYAKLSVPVTPAQVDAINHLEFLTTPLLIQHARGDRSVPYQWSENLVVKLNELDKDFKFYTYDSDNHLFADDNRERAIQRDLEFFSGHAENQ